MKLSFKNPEDWVDIAGHFSMAMLIGSFGVASLALALCVLGTIISVIINSFS